MDEIISPGKKKLWGGGGVVMEMLSNLFEKCSRCHVTQFWCYPANAINCTLCL